MGRTRWTRTGSRLCRPATRSVTPVSAASSSIRNSVRGRGRVARIVIDARVVAEDLRWEPVCLDLTGVQHLRIDESRHFSWVLYDPPMFTHFDGLMRVDLCAERFGRSSPQNAREVFEGSDLVFSATGGTWSALRPWD